MGHHNCGSTAFGREVRGERGKKLKIEWQKSFFEFKLSYMSDSEFKIHERTVLLYGSTGPMACAISNRLAELGADIAVVNGRASQLRTFVDSINDMREIHPHYGRLATIDIQVTNENQAGEAISQTAETFGSLDVLIDLSAVENTKCSTQIKGSKCLGKKAFAFLTKRTRGRMIYVFNSQNIYNEEHPTDIMSLYGKLIRTKKGQGITLNCLSLGMNEDYLRSHFPECANMEEARQKVLDKTPEAQLINPNEVADLISFLCSPLSSAINGQIITVDKGLSNF